MFTVIGVDTPEATGPLLVHVAVVAVFEHVYPAAEALVIVPLVIRKLTVAVAASGPLLFAVAV